MEKMVGQVDVTTFGRGSTQVAIVEVDRVFTAPLEFSTRLAQSAPQSVAMCADGWLCSRSRRDRALRDAARARRIRSESASFANTRTSRPIAAPIARETRCKKRSAIDSRIERDSLNPSNTPAKPSLNPRNRAIHRARAASSRRFSTASRSIDDDERSFFRSRARIFAENVPVR